MRKALPLVLSALAISYIVHMHAWTQSAALSAPPVAPVRPVIDDDFGTKVTDPYRHMENLADPEVKEWMTAQNDYARAVLARIPGRAKMRDRLRELDQSAPAFVSGMRRMPGEPYFIKSSRGAGTSQNSTSWGWSTTTIGFGLHVGQQCEVAP
jgi:hypothetical protein